MGMKYIHLSIDMQLFADTKQVCWPVVTFLTPTKGSIGHVSANPGAMHVIQLHCKAEFSAQVYEAAAYAGLTGTIRVTSPS